MVSERTIPLSKEIFKSWMKNELGNPFQRGLMYQMGHLNKSKNPEVIPSYNGLIACRLIENRDFILLLCLKKQGMQQGPLNSILIDCICLTSQFPLISGGSEQQGKDLERKRRSLSSDVTKCTAYIKCLMYVIYVIPFITFY